MTEVGLQVVEKEELLESLLCFLDYMRDEVEAEKKSLGFNDAWMELEHLAIELDIELNGKAVDE